MGPLYTAGKSEQAATIRPILLMDLYLLRLLRLVSIRGDPAAKEQGGEMGLSDQILEVWSIAICSVLVLLAKSHFALVTEMDIGFASSQRDWW